MAIQPPNDLDIYSNVSLSNKVLKLFFILLVFFALTALVIFSFVWQNISYENNKARVTFQAQSSAFKLEQYINDSESLVTQMALLTSVISPDQLSQQLQSVLQEHHLSEEIISAYVLPIKQKSLVLKEDRFFSAKNESIDSQYKRTDWFKNTSELSKGNVNWSRSMTDENINISSATISAPYFKDGKFAGVIAMRIQLLILDLSLDKLDHDFLGYSLLIDQYNQVIHFSDKFKTTELSSENLQFLIDELQYNFLGKNIFIQEKMISNVFSEPVILVSILEPKTQWRLVVMVPKSELAAGSSLFLGSLVMGFSLLICSILIIAWYVIKTQLLLPLSSLNKSKKVVSPYKELNSLVSTVNSPSPLDQQDTKLENTKVASEKGQLIEDIVREIKTPINTILSSVSLLKRSNLSPQDREYMNLVERSTKMSMTVLDNVTNYSKIIAGDLVLERCRFDLFALLDQVYTSLRVKLSGNLRVRFSLNYSEDNHRFFYGDPKRLQQVLIDLVSNALKFTSRGFVELKVESISKPHLTGSDSKKDNCKEEVFIFTITDSGVGMAKNKIDLLLKPPSSDLYSSINLHKPGITLSICHRLILLMGGRLTAKSILGEGSTFQIKLPLQQAEQLGRQHLISRNAMIVDKLANLQVLVIDGHKINQVLAQKILHLLHIRAYVCEDVVSAQEIIQKNKIDMIYLKADDLSTCVKSLRNMSDKEIPIVGLLEDKNYLDYRSIELAGAVSMPLTRQNLVEETVRILGFESSLADVLHPLNQKLEL